MNSKMTTNSQLSTTKPKKQQQRPNKPLEQEQNHRNGVHMESYQWGGGGGEWGEKIQGIRSIIGRYKMDRGRLRIVQEMEKPKNLYVQSVDISWGNDVGMGGAGQKGIKVRKIMGQP